MPLVVADLVQDFGAGPTRSFAENNLAIRNAVEQCGGELHIPDVPYPGIQHTEPLVIENRTGPTIYGARGSVAASTMTGSRLIYRGPQGGMSVFINRANSWELRNLGLFSFNKDVNGVFTDTAIHLVNDPPIGNIAGHDGNIENVNVARYAIGIQNGRTDANQPLLSEMSLRRFRATACGIGIFFQSDQGANWTIEDYNALSCGTGLKLTDGWGKKNRGNFVVRGGGFGNNGIDFDIPDVTFSIRIEDVTSEKSDCFLKVDPTGPAAYYTYILDRIKHTPRAGGKSIIFKQGHDLVVRDSFLGGAVEIGQPFNPSSSYPLPSNQNAPMRTFERNWMSRPIFLNTDKWFFYEYRAGGHWGNNPDWDDIQYEYGNQHGPLIRHDRKGNIYAKGFLPL